MAEYSIKETLETVSEYIGEEVKDAIDDGLATKEEIFRVTTMPTASVDYVDKVYQYVGTTTGTYTNGYFYKCTATTEEVGGENVTTYKWEQINVQPKFGADGIVLVDGDIDLNEDVDPGSLIQYIGETTSDFTKGVVYEIAPLIAELSNDDILLHYTMESSTETQTYTATEAKTIFALVLCLGGGGTQSITTTGAELWSYEKNDQALDIGKGNILTKIIEVDSGDTITYSGSANTRTRQVFMLMDYGDKPNEMDEVLFEGSNDFIVTPYTATYTADEDCAILAIGMACRMSTGSGYAYSLSTKINNEAITDKKARVAENKYAVDVVSRYLKTGDTVDFSGTSGAVESYASGGVMYYVFKLGHSTVPCSPSRASNSQIEEIKAQFNPSSTANVNIQLYEIYDEDGVEQVVGEVRKTIDGVKKKKPLYRVSIITEHLPSNSGITEYSTNITDVDEVISFYGVAGYAEQSYRRYFSENSSRPANNHNDQIGCELRVYNNHNLVIAWETGYDRLSNSGNITALYTKTTDAWQTV